MSRILWLIAMSVLLAACGTLDSSSRSVSRVYVPQFIKFEYNFMGKYRVSHEYLYGPGVESCFYVGKRAKSYMEDGQAMYPYASPRMDDFTELNGHVFEGGVTMDINVIGIPEISELTGHYDKVKKEWVGGMPYVDFEPLCSDWVGSHDFMVELHKSSSMSIGESIANDRLFLDGPWKQVSHWLPPYHVRRGKNDWLVFKSWNRAIYLADASEDWYLPIGDGAYYFKISFAYQSGEMKDDPVQYARARAMFDHIIDSFKIEKLRHGSADGSSDDGPSQKGH